MKERSADDVRPGAPSEPPATPRDLVVHGSLARCPYCHDALAATDDWLACASCVAKHHRACWNEHGRCATCDGHDALRRASAAPRLRVRLAIPALLLGMAVLGRFHGAVANAVRGLVTTTGPSVTPALEDVPLVAVLGKVSPDDWISSVECTPDGSSALLCKDDRLELWDLRQTGVARLQRTYPIEGRKGSGRARCSPDFRRAAICRSDRLQILDLETGAVETLEEIPWSQVRSVACDTAFTPDGEKLLVGGSGGSDLWDLKTRKKLWTTRRPGEPTGYEWSVQVFPDGKRALVGGHYGLRVVDLADGKDLAVLDAQGADDWVYHGVLSPDSKQVISCPGASTIMRVWDLSTTRILKTLEPSSDLPWEKQMNRGVAWLPGGHAAVSIDASGAVSFWNLESDASPLHARELLRLDTQPGKDPTPTSLAVAPDGRRLFIGTSQGTTFVYELTDKVLRGGR